ncbi:ABC transporter substrate-binding protein [Actinomycetospora atypica]|uniref:Probable sugar-binding periplasmic protein n=1 Tax=Actinomycetospora atypica TaxID=1290095 RepID=A0ABV9YUF6_9PSEU
MTPERPARGRVELLAWATAGDEKAAVDAVAEEFTRAWPGHEVLDAVLPAGAADGHEALGARLQAERPPDSFQVHPGAEVREYVEGGLLGSLTEEVARWGLADVLPRGLLDGVSVDGEVYAVPAGIHRLVLWGNEGVLSRAGLAVPAAGFEEFIDHLDALSASGLRHPLAVGADWAQLGLLEGVLLATLGPERFRSLWSKAADWSGTDVAEALTRYRALLAYTPPDRDHLTWAQAADLLRRGEAGYLFMGDWVLGAWERQGFRSYSHRPFPGADGTFQWLGDAFVLPRDAPNSEAAIRWLATVGGPEGQRAFSLRKGSVPARIDADRADYSTYRRDTMDDLAGNELVPSCAHGSACTRAEAAAVVSAVGRFSASGDIEALRSEIAAGVAAYGPGESGVDARRVGSSRPRSS